jgi:hypothetical protein
MYTVYKITNLVNQKYYIGVHKTDNPYDSYMGSGYAVKSAIKKHGRKNFIKEILFTTVDKEEAYAFEKKLTEDYMTRDSYNMKIGGVGGFSRENALKGHAASLKKLTKQQRSDNGKLGYAAMLPKINLNEIGRRGGQANRGKPKSEAHKEKLRQVWRDKKIRASRQEV